MMKFFRKYNKHLLAVFMALLLVIWLGGDAVESMLRPDFAKEVVGSAASGKITRADINRATHEADLQELVGLSWERAFVDQAAPRDEQLDIVDWILLQREATGLGISVDSSQAKAMLASVEPLVRQRAAQRDVPVEDIYAAAARYFAVQNMLVMYSTALQAPEPALRVIARDVFDRATIEAVILPAESFADPEEVFSEAELEEQFAKFKEKPSGQGGLNFGYYLDPEVSVEYIKIDPQKIKEQLRGGDSAYERRAYTYWKENSKTDLRFRRSPAEMEAARARLAGDDATTNGKDSVPPVVSPYYESFAEAREKALEGMKEADARAEADRIANLLVRVVAEPWFDIPAGPDGYKPAPEKVKSGDYYAEVLTKLPANLQYGDAVEIGTLEGQTARALAADEGIGRAYVLGQQDAKVPFAHLAFDVEGLAKIPADARGDQAQYLSLWQTSLKPLSTDTGVIYLYRITAAGEGRVPDGLAEVRDQVVEDLRLQRGMERAKQAAEEFAQQVGTSGLKEAWEADTELVDQVTPDRGGYVDVPPFPRDASRLGAPKNSVMPIGIVTDGFMGRAFALAEKGEESGVAVEELPDLAKVAVIKGKSLRPLYGEDYELRRGFLKDQLSQVTGGKILRGWLNAKSVRARNKYEPVRGA